MTFAEAVAQIEANLTAKGYLDAEARAVLGAGGFTVRWRAKPDRSGDPVTGSVRGDYSAVNAALTAAVAEVDALPEVGADKRAEWRQQAATLLARGHVLGFRPDLLAQAEALLRQASE